MKSKTNIWALIFPILYILVLLMASMSAGPPKSEQGISIAADLLMTIALLLGLLKIYDWESTIFTVNNIMYLLMFGIGFFIRYIIIRVFPEWFMRFAPHPIGISGINHLRCAIAVLIATVMLFFGKRIRIYRKNNKNALDNENADFLNSDKAVLLFLICLLIGYTYRFLNIRVSTQLNYGNYDTLMSLFTTMAKTLAYAFLVKFSRDHKKKYLYLYLIYIVPTLTLSILQAWKGTILYETLIILIIFNEGIKKVKKRYLILILSVAVLVFPMISMLRDNMKYATGYAVNINSIISYNKNHNILEYYSNRLQYYDEAYYVVNVDRQDLALYRQEAKGIVTRFFSGLIPRAIWNDKPIVNSGRYVTYTLLHYPSNQYNNLSIGFIGDAFASYGYIGVAIFTLLYGGLIGKIERMRKKDTSMFSQAIYVVVGNSVFSYIEGDIAAKTIGVMLALICFFIIRLILRETTIYR